MKKIILLAVVFSIALVSCKNEKTKEVKVITEEVKEVKKENTTQDLQKVNDVIVWKGYKPTGSHNGTIDVKSSEFKFDGEKLVGGVVVFDMSSVKCLDIEDANDNKDFVDHLKGEDFFDVEKHPTSKFELTKVIFQKDSSLQVIGDLTLNGITKEIKFAANLNNNIFKSKIIKIDRTDFGVKYKSKKFFDNLKDKFINDEFDISFVIKLK